MKTILRKLRKLISLALFFTVVSCSSVSEKVIIRSDDLSERPNWVSLEKASFVKDGRLFIVGLSESNADARISAVLRVADNNARFEISRMVSDEMAYIFQNLEEGLDNGGQLARFYGTEISKVISNSVNQESRYWEKVETFDSYGQKIYKLRVYSMISIKEHELRKLVSETLNKGPTITPAVKQQIDDHITTEIKKLSQG